MSWNIVSRSLRELLPFSPASSSLMNADDLRCGACSNIVLITRERSASRAGGSKQNLIRFEGRRLEHYLDAVRQLPFGDAQHILRRGFTDRAGRWHCVEQRRRSCSVSVGLQIFTAGGFDNRFKF